MPDESFTYDTVGNRLAKQGQTIQSVFDDANRLVEVAKFSGVEKAFLIEGAENLEKSMFTEHMLYRTELRGLFNDLG